MGPEDSRFSSIPRRQDHILKMQALPSKGFPVGLMVKNPLAKIGDVGSVPASGRSPGEGNGNPLQYSCLGNDIDRGTWFGLQSMGSKKSRTLVID